MNAPAPDNWRSRACTVLAAADAGEKARLAETVLKDRAAAWLDISPTAHLPDRPARPARPELRPPRAMPKRKLGGSAEARGAFLHAIAHIELNAIDLACDMAARFGGDEVPADFVTDWLSVAADEGRHFRLLAERLEEFGYRYGDFPAHDGLWQAADRTREDLLGRLSVVPLVLEARGLDVTPGLIDKARRLGDTRTAEILEIIYREEVAHVAAGAKWLRYFCAREAKPVEETYREKVRQYFPGGLKPPFNTDARSRAGLSARMYRPLTQKSRDLQ